jgi:acyl-CoA reductase-like NAD-dependent aldehyde dehydrogenase
MEEHARADTRAHCDAAARLLEDNKEELAQILTREEGKTIGESRGELAALDQRRRILRRRSQSAQRRNDSNRNCPPISPTRSKQPHGVGRR